MNNPYYNEDQAWMHPAQNAQTTYNQQLQTRWFEQQEADRQHQFYMHSTQADFAGLQNAAQQAAPHRHHHNGPGWGGVAAGALAGYYFANRQQSQQPQVVRPQGWKGDVWGWYVLLGLFLHFIVANLIVGDSVGVAVFFLVIGTAIWVPVWALAYRHQRRIWAHNDALERAASQLDVSAVAESTGLDRYHAETLARIAQQN